MMNLVPAHTRDIGPRLRQVVADLIRDYDAIAATPETWVRATPQAWNSVWQGFEAFEALEAAGRKAGGTGCPFVAKGCPPDGPVCCKTCSDAAQGRQEAMTL